MTAHPARPTTSPPDNHPMQAGPHLHHVWPIVTVLLLLAVLVYTLACAATPFAQCRRCDGNGKYRKARGRAWHPCKHCKGSGHRLRWGRHVTNYVHRTRDHAARATQQRNRLTSWRPR